MCSVDNNMTPRQHNFNVFLRTLAYTSLLAGGLFFSKDAFDQYLVGKTALQISQQTLAPEDFPAVTICFDDFDDDFCESMSKDLDWNVTYFWAMDDFGVTSDEMTYR